MREAHWVRGSELNEEDKLYVLSSYDRFTKECMPRRAVGDNRKPLHNSDWEWLLNSLFRVRVDGRLDMRYKRCMPVSIWSSWKLRSRGS